MTLPSTLVHCAGPSFGTASGRRVTEAQEASNPASSNTTSAARESRPRRGEHRPPARDLCGKVLKCGLDKGLMRQHTGIQREL